MKLIAFLNKGRNEEIRNDSRESFFMNAGYANGYVAVPPEHPYHGVDYDRVIVRVHGGLTFDASAREINNTENPMWKNLEFLGDETELPDDWWVFGFDTLHCDDSLQTWPRERCVMETLKLKDQLEQMSNNVIFK